MLDVTCPGLGPPPPPVPDHPITDGRAARRGHDVSLSDENLTSSDEGSTPRTRGVDTVERAARCVMLRYRTRGTRRLRVSYYP